MMGSVAVSSEVRKLAERTTVATKQIAEMINAIQSETSEAVRAMKQGREEMVSRVGLEGATWAIAQVKKIPIKKIAFLKDITGFVLYAISPLLTERLLSFSQSLIFAGLRGMFPGIQSHHQQKEVTPMNTKTHIKAGGYVWSD